MRQSNKVISSKKSTQQRSPESSKPRDTTSGFLNLFGIFSDSEKKETTITNNPKSRKMSSSNKIEQKTQYYSNGNSNYDTNLHEKSR